MITDTQAKLVAQEILTAYDELVMTSNLAPNLFEMIDKTVIFRLDQESGLPLATLIKPSVYLRMPEVDKVNYRDKLLSMPIYMRDIIHSLDVSKKNKNEIAQIRRIINNNKSQENENYVDSVLVALNNLEKAYGKHMRIKRLNSDYQKVTAKLEEIDNRIAYALSQREDELINLNNIEKIMEEDYE